MSTAAQERPVLVVATPCYGGMCTTAYTNSLLNLQQACLSRGIGVTWFLGSGDALITRARADLVARFLDKADATHLLFVDADVGFDSAQALRLLGFDADVSAGAYPAKHIDWKKVVRAVTEQRPKLESAALTYVLGLAEKEKIVTREGFAKVRYAGNGFLMIRRAALLKMCAAYPQLKYKGVHSVADPLKDSPNRFALFDCMIDAETGVYLSEDFAFCRRWTDLGGEIWLDLQSKLTHVGPMRFVGDLSTQFDPSGGRT